MKKAVCVHEEDAGICWKHTEYRDGHAEVRRNRRLVMSFIATGAACSPFGGPRDLTREFSVHAPTKQCSALAIMASLAKIASKPALGHPNWTLCA